MAAARERKYECLELIEKKGPGFTQPNKEPGCQVSAELIVRENLRNGGWGLGGTSRFFSQRLSASLSGK